MIGPEGSPLRVIHRIRSLRDAGRNAELVIMSSIIIIIPVVNQPIARRQAVARTKANE